MRADTIILPGEEHDCWSICTGQPSSGTDLSSLDDDWTEIEDEFRSLHAHSISEYCTHSRHIAKKCGRRPVYMGYHITPKSPLGLCR